MSKPAPREWFIKNSFVDDHANIDGPKTKGAHVIEKPAYDRLAEENKILREAIKNMQGILSPNRKGHHAMGCETRAIDVGFTALARVEVLE